MDDFLLQFSLWEQVWSCHKSEQSSWVFVDPLPVTAMLAVEVTHPSPICLSRCCSSPALPACTATSQPSQVKPDSLAEVNYFNLLRLFGSSWLRRVWKQLHQELGSRLVGEVALTSAKGWLQGAGGWLEALISGAPRKGVQTPGESCWGSLVWMTS